MITFYGEEGRGALACGWLAARAGRSMQVHPCMWPETLHATAPRVPLAAIHPCPPYLAMSPEQTKGILW